MISRISDGRKAAGPESLPKLVTVNILGVYENAYEG